MDDLSTHDRAVALLQQLGLKEYEAKSFVALTRRPEATAKEISEVSDVPRTRVYDAVRVLENKGLVETQHSSPKQFRAVTIDEATDTLRAEYDARITELQETLADLEPTDPDEQQEITHEVWALSGQQAIASRAQSLIDDADEEVMFVVGREAAFTESTAARLRAAVDRGVTVIVGTPHSALRDRIQAAVPDAEVFRSELEWLRNSALTGDNTEISRLLLADRMAILVSSTYQNGSDRDEQAVFGRGFENGVVAIVRRLMATGLLPRDDPGVDDAADTDSAVDTDRG